MSSVLAVSTALSAHAFARGPRGGIFTMAAHGCSDAPVHVSIRYPQRVADNGGRTKWQHQVRDNIILC